MTRRLPPGTASIPTTDGIRVRSIQVSPRSLPIRAARPIRPNTQSQRARPPLCWPTSFRTAPHSLLNRPRQPDAHFCSPASRIRAMSRQDLNFPRTPKSNSDAAFGEFAVGGRRTFQYWDQTLACLLSSIGWTRTRHEPLALTPYSGPRSTTLASRVGMQNTAMDDPCLLGRSGRQDGVSGTQPPELSGGAWLLLYGIGCSSRLPVPARHRSTRGTGRGGQPIAHCSRHPLSERHRCRTGTRTGGRGESNRTRKSDGSD
jgi:hypothetical protein